MLGDRFFGNSPSVAADGGVPLKFTPLRLPHPLPIYTQQKSYLSTGIEQGSILEPSANTALSHYTVIDDVVVPPEYERYVIVAWGDRVSPIKKNTLATTATTRALFLLIVETSMMAICGTITSTYLTLLPLPYPVLQAIATL